MFWNNKQKKIDERIAEFLNIFYKYGSDINDQIYIEISKKNILIILEIYGYFVCLSDYFIARNNVENKYRRMFFEYSWGSLKYSKRWIGLNLTEDEKNKFIDDRINNYSNILNTYKGINAGCFEKTIEYQIQLILNIIEKNKLSYFNPLPKEPWEHSPIHTDFLANHALNGILTNFFIKGVSRVINGLEKNFVNEFFNSVHFEPRI
jgi:hypothetical protein